MTRKRRRFTADTWTHVMDLIPDESVKLSI